MADTHEKKVEKKVVKEEPRAPEHAHKAAEPAHKAPEPAHKTAGPAHKAPEPAHKTAEPVHKAPEPAHKTAEPAHKAPAARDLADEIGHELDLAKPAAAPVKKVEARPAAPKAEAVSDERQAAKKADEKPADEKEPAPGSDAEAKAPAPGEAEPEIVEDEETKKKAKPEKKKGKKKKARKVHPKPELTAEVRSALKLRKALKDHTPNFIRQEAYNYGRLCKAWRRPQGTHSKLRHHIKYRINVVSIGYGGPNASKGLHPSGFREVLVHHPKELDGVNPKTHAARIAHGVGIKKREMIERRAERMGIRVLNESV